MKELRIFDVSAFIHAGKINRHSFLLPELVDDGEVFREYRIHTGGASLLWNVLYHEYGKGDMVFCTDRRPTIKQEMLTEYKGTREHDSEVGKEKEVCEYLLEQCGFTVLGADGYEADDFIHSLVMEHKESYDHIYIYCNDSDLYYLVDDNVSCLPSSSRAKTVDRQNYTYTVRKDQYTPYNALTFYKILYGDKSDNIPGLPNELAARIRSSIDNEVYHPHMGNKEVMLDVFSRFGEEASAQASLVFPLDVRVPSTFLQGDKMCIAEWGSAMRNKMWRTGGPIPTHIQEKIEEMVTLGFASDQ